MVALPFYTYLKSTKKPFAKQYNPNPKTIGEHIRKKRIESGMLQKDVAILLDASEDTLTGWESHRSEPQISFFPKIIRFLGYYPYHHSIHTASGLIERCRYTLGLSYDDLGKRVGVYGSTIIHWKRSNMIAQKQCEEKLRQLL